ncbi:MAG: hypothetical protein JOY88_03775 [Pelomonas sp.]|nr:hypothetical protein [Roseateles sp.]
MTVASYLDTLMQRRLGHVLSNLVKSLKISVRNSGLVHACWAWSTWMPCRATSSSARPGRASSLLRVAGGWG